MPLPPSSSSSSSSSCVSSLLETDSSCVLQPSDEAVQAVLLGDCTSVEHPHLFTLCRLPSLFLSSLQPVEFVFSLDSLRFLDLHGNQIQRLPSATAWRCLPNLQVLLLHRNYISSLRNLAALGSLPSLELLTLHHNPVALHPNYRSFILSSVDGLEVLDENAVADEELMEGLQLGNPVFGAMGPRTHFPLSEEDMTITSERQLDRFIFRIRRAKARGSAATTIQSFFKMISARRGFEERLAQASAAAVNIQRIVRGRIARRRHPSKSTIQERAAIVVQRAFRFHRLHRLAFCMKVSPGEQFAFEGHNLGVVQEALRRSLFLAGSDPEGQDPVVLCPLKLEALRSNLWGSPPGTPRPAQRRRPGRRRQSELLSAFRRCTRSPKGAIFRLRPSSRPVVQLLAQHKMRLTTVSDPSVLQGADPFLQALRRPSFVGVSQLRSFLETLRESYETKEHTLYALEIRDVRVGSFFFQQLAQLLEEGSQCVMWSHLGEIRRIAAAVSVQAAWRARRTLCRMDPPLMHQLLARRAAVCVQRWWRGCRDRMRVRLLDHSRDMFGLFMENPFALLPVSCYRRAMELEARGGPPAAGARVLEQSFAVAFSRPSTTQPPSIPLPEKFQSDHGLCILANKNALQSMPSWLGNTLKMFIPPREGVELFHWKSHRLTSILRWGSTMRVVSASQVAQAMEQDEDFRLYMEFMGGLQEVVMFQYRNASSLWMRNLLFGLLTHTPCSPFPVAYMIDSPTLRRQHCAAVIQRAWRARCLRRRRRVDRLRRKYKVGIPEAEALLDAALEAGEWVSDGEGQGDSEDEEWDELNEDMPEEWPRSAADMLRQATMVVEAKRRQRQRFEEQMQARFLRTGDSRELRGELRRAAQMARSKQERRERARMMAMLTPRGTATTALQRDAADSGGAARPRSAPGGKRAPRRSHRHPRKGRGSVGTPSTSSVVKEEEKEGDAGASTAGEGSVSWWGEDAGAGEGSRRATGAVVELPRLVLVSSRPASSAGGRGRGGGDEEASSGGEGAAASRSWTHASAGTTGGGSSSLSGRREELQQRAAREASSVRMESVQLALQAQEKREREQRDLLERMRAQKERHARARDLMERMKASATANLRKQQKEELEARRQLADDQYQEMVLDRTARMRAQRQAERQRFLEKQEMEQAEKAGQNRGDREALRKALEMRAMADQERVRSVRRAASGVPVSGVPPLGSSPRSMASSGGEVLSARSGASGGGPLSARRRGGGGAVHPEDAAAEFMRQHNMIDRHTRTGELARRRLLEEESTRKQVEERKKESANRKAQLSQMLEAEYTRRRKQVTISNELRKKMLEKKMDEERARIREARQKAEGTATSGPSSSSGSGRRPRFSSPRGSKPARQLDEEAEQDSCAAGGQEGEGKGSLPQETVRPEGSSSGLSGAPRGGGRGGAGAGAGGAGSKVARRAQAPLSVVEFSTSLGGPEEPSSSSSSSSWQSPPRGSTKQQRLQLQLQEEQQQEESRVGLGSGEGARRVPPPVVGKLGRGREPLVMRVRQGGGPGSASGLLRRPSSSASGPLSSWSPSP